MCKRKDKRSFAEYGCFAACSVTECPSLLPQVGSPTALAEAAVERNLLREARDGAHGLYVPAGAFWGGQDIQKMADRGTLRVRALLEIGPLLTFSLGR